MNIKVGIVGLGTISKTHLNTLKSIKDVELVAVCDVDKQKVKDAQKEFGGEPYFDFNEMLKEQALDAILICVPQKVRYEPIESAVRKGLAIFCEKPPAFDMETARKVERVIKKSKVINSVGFMYRYSKITDMAKELIKGHTISMMRSTFLCSAGLNPNLPGWFLLKEHSGGPLLDQAIHFIDVERYILGDISRLQTFSNNLVLPKSSKVTIEDSHSVNLCFTSGVIGNHLHSWIHRGWVARVEIYGENLHLCVDYVNKAIFGKVSDTEIKKETPDDDCYTTELNQFFAAIQKKDQSLIRSSYSDAVKSLATVLTANKSIQTEKTEEIGG